MAGAPHYHLFHNGRPLMNKHGRAAHFVGQGQVRSAIVSLLLSSQITLPQDPSTFYYVGFLVKPCWGGVHCPKGGAPQPAKRGTKP